MRGEFQMIFNESGRLFELRGFTIDILLVKKGFRIMGDFQIRFNDLGGIVGLGKISKGDLTRWRGFELEMFSKKVP